MSATRPQHLLQLSESDAFLRCVGDSLEELSQQPWKAVTHDAICSAIAKRLSAIQNIFCYGGNPKNTPAGCAGSEWLFDFCALLYEEPEGTRFVVQAAIIGETEWNPSDKSTDEDFEKLLVVDSILCFFVCGVKSRDEALRKLARYEEIV